MPDSTLNIRTIVQTAPVTQLNATLKDLRAQWNGLSADERKSPTGQFLASQINQLSVAVKEAHPNIEAMTQKVRVARGEHRLLAFGMMSLIGTFDAFAGHNAKVVQGLHDAAGAGMGVKFGLDMLGGTFAKFSTPLALVTGGLAAYKAISDGAKESEKAHAETMEKRIDLLNQLGEATDRQVMREKDLAVQRAKTEQKEGIGFFSKVTSGLGAYIRGFFGGGGGVAGAALGTLAANEAAAQAVENDALEKGNVILEKRIARMKMMFELADKMHKQQDQTIQYERQLQELENRRPFAPANRRLAALQGVARSFTLTQSQQNIMNDLMTGNNRLPIGAANRREAILQKRGLGTSESELRTMAGLTKDIATGFDKIGMSIESAIINKLHFANNLAGQLGRTLLETAMSVIGTVASEGAGSGIPGLVLALIGGGKARAGKTQ